MNKQKILDKMLALEGAAWVHAREKYLAFVASAKLDRTEPIEADEQAQAELASDLSEAFDQPVHSHQQNIERLKLIDFSPKSCVEPGAVVKVAGRHFVIAVATDRFRCEGVELMGISPQAQIYSALEGKSAGDVCVFNDRALTVERIW